MTAFMLTLLCELLPKKSFIFTKYTRSLKIPFCSLCMFLEYIIYNIENLPICEQRLTYRAIRVQCKKIYMFPSGRNTLIMRLYVAGKEELYT